MSTRLPKSLSYPSIGVKIGYSRRYRPDDLTGGHVLSANFYKDLENDVGRGTGPKFKYDSFRLFIIHEQHRQDYTLLATFLIPNILD